MGRETACDSDLSTQFPALSTPIEVPRSCDAFELAHLYEQFLHRYAPKTRKHHGVFFTPQPIADYIVRQIDASPATRLRLPDGLAFHSTIRNPQSAIHFLDPACGTGVFLLAVIDFLQRQAGRRAGTTSSPISCRGSSASRSSPPPPSWPSSTSPPKLAETGYDFSAPAASTFDSATPSLLPFQSAIRNPQSAIPILLGNPPFSSLSTNTNPWIARLVRGDDEIRGYVQANGQRLGERKTWLHDDYVKFIRLAQWHVEAGRLRHRRLRHQPRLSRQRHVPPDAAASCCASFPASRSSICTATARRAKSRPTAATTKTSSASTRAWPSASSAGRRRQARSASEGEMRSDEAPRVEYAELVGTRAKQSWRP